VTWSYEGQENALDDAFKKKVTIYTELARQLDTGIARSVAVRPIIVGSLGGWQRSNEQCLKALSITSNLRILQCQLSVADAIAGSMTIWCRLESGLADQSTARRMLAASQR